MGGREMRKPGYVKQITFQMQQLGTYKEEFKILIDTMAQICADRDENMKEWKQFSLEHGSKAKLMAMEYTNKAGATNLSKTPYYLNNLQFNEQILKYGKALGLTPTDINKACVDTSNEDPLDKFVAKFTDDFE